MSFWDSADDFTHELVVNTFLVIPDYQSDMWYIEYLDEWVTTDKSGMLNSWDLVTHQIKSVYNIKNNKGGREKESSVKDSNNPDIMNSKRHIIAMVEIEY